MSLVFILPIYISQVLFFSIQDLLTLSEMQIAQSKTWVTYQNPKGKFKINFPTNPYYETLNHRILNQQVTRHIFTSHGKLETFQISYYDLPLDEYSKSDIYKNIEKYYDIVADRTASEVNGKVISQSTFKYKTYSGREIKLDGVLMNQQVKHIIRVIIIDNRQYSLWFSTKPEYFRINLMYDFFNSFQIL